MIEVSRPRGVLDMPAVMLHARCWSLVQRVIGVDVENHLDILYDILTNASIPGFALTFKTKSFKQRSIPNDEIIGEGRNLVMMCANDCLHDPVD